MKKLLYCATFVMLAAFAVSSRAVENENVPKRTNPSTPEDALLLAIESNDFVAVEDLLSSGANPNASNGKPRDGHTLCLATEPGRETSLRLAIDHGADIDRLYNDSTSYGSPLACAITRGGSTAFVMLIEAGADPALDVCISCEHSMNNGPAEIALHSQRYRELWSLLELNAVNSRAMSEIVYALETYPAFGDEITNPYRRKIVEWLEAQGTALDLRTPLPE